MVKLAIDEVRCRVQKDALRHRGDRGDPLYRIRNVLRAGQENLTDRQQTRLEAASGANETHLETEVTQ